MGNQVVVIGDSGTLSIQGIPVGGVPDLEFRSGSFRASAQERRVCGVFMFIPTGGKEFELRFEFTDPVFAQEDIKGRSTKHDPNAVVEPYREPRAERPLDEGR